MQYKGGNFSWRGRSTEMGDVSLRLSFLPTFLSLATMGFHNSTNPQSGWSGKDITKGSEALPLLMSPVFNHLLPVEWFYAISFAYRPNMSCRAFRTKSTKLGEREKGLWCLSSSGDLFNSLSFAKSVWLENLWDWIQPWILLILAGWLYIFKN